MNDSDASMQRTRVSLLLRLRQVPGDLTAWEQFVARYGPQVHAWCRRWGLQEADAADVTQNVLVRLTEKLREFEYDPSKRFRAWLKTLTQHAWSDFYRARSHGGGSGDSAVLDVLNQVEARDDLLVRLRSTFDLELLEQAYEQVRKRVEERTWQIFEMTAFEGKSGVEVAQHLGMKVGSVFAAKSKVQAMLQEIVQKEDE